MYLLDCVSVAAQLGFRPFPALTVQEIKDVGDLVTLILPAILMNGMNFFSLWEFSCLINILITM